MPPRAAKKSPAPGPKRTPRSARGTPKAQNPTEVVEEAAKVEETAGSVVEVEAEVVKVEEIVEEKTADKVSEPESDPKSEANGKLPEKKEDEVKETVEEDEKGERLELEDNEPDYEPEEYVGTEYYDKENENENEDPQEGEELEEEAEEGDEGDIGEEEEGDVAEEEDGDAPEEHDGGEDDAEQHGGGGGEHADAEMVAAAEEEEHHDVFQERRKRKEFEIFVGGLDKDASEEDLRKVFGEVGEVTEVRLMMNPQTKKNKGFAFIRFASVEQAKRAVTELKNPVVNGKQCGVTPSQDSDTLFLGNICKTWTKEALKEKLKHYGVDTIEDLTLVEDGNNEGMNRGFAFLEFSSRSDAMDAFKRLQKRDVVFGVDRNAKVSFADSFIDPGDEIMAQVKTVFIDGLPSSWDEDRVRELLKKYGELEKIELARNMPSAKRKDFGFVTFNTHDAAVTCAKSINNSEIGEGDNKVKVRARLSRPLQRGKGKHVPSGAFRSSHGAGRGARGPWGRPLPPRSSFPLRGARGMSSRVPSMADRGLKRPIAFRDRRPIVSMRARGRPLPPISRSYDRRAPVPPYPKGGSSTKRDYGRHNEPPQRGRAAAADYGGSRAAADRRMSYRDGYSARGSGYAEPPPRSAPRAAPRRVYVDDGYGGPRFERPPPSYREGRARDYDSVSGSKRPYSAMDDVPPRYSDAGAARQSRARLDYDIGSGSSQYGDAYSDRLGRSSLAYGSSRTSLSSQDSHGLYSSSRQGVSYGGGSYGSSDVGGVYSSSYTGDYMSRGADVGGGSSYSSLYSGRGLDGSSYMGSGGSGSYY